MRLAYRLHVFWLHSNQPLGLNAEQFRILFLRRSSVELVLALRRCCAVGQLIYFVLKNTHTKYVCSRGLYALSE